MEEVNFGERILTIRLNAGLSQIEFCSQLGIPQSTLSAYETDKMQPTVSTLIKLAAAYNVSMDWLCGIEKSTNQFIDSKEIGKRIKVLRLEHELTQTEFSKLIGKSLRTVQKYEKGEIEISISVANEIAQALEVPAAHILGNTDNFEVTPESLTKDNAEIQ